MSFHDAGYRRCNCLKLDLDLDLDPDSILLSSVNSKTVWHDDFPRTVLDSVRNFIIVIIVVVTTDETKLRITVDAADKSHVIQAAVHHAPR